MVIRILKTEHRLQIPQVTTKMAEADSPPQVEMAIIQRMVETAIKTITISTQRELDWVTTSLVSSTVFFIYKLLF